jgi:hypothetical protein
MACSIVVNRQLAWWPDGPGTNTHGIFCRIWKVLFEVLGVNEVVHNASSQAFNCSLRF